MSGRPPSRLEEEVHEEDLPDVSQLSLQEQRRNHDRLRPTTRRLAVEDPVAMRRLAISQDISHQRDEREALIQLVRKHAIDEPKTEEEINAITEKYRRIENYRRGNDELRELRNRLVTEKEEQRQARLKRQAELRAAAHEAAEILRLKGDLYRMLEKAHDAVFTRCTPPYLGTAADVMALAKKFEEDPLAIDKLSKRDLETKLSQARSAYLASLYSDYLGAVFDARSPLEGRAKALAKLKKKEAARRSKKTDPRRSNKECAVMSLSKDGSHHPNLTTRQEARYELPEEALRARWRSSALE